MTRTPPRFGYSLIEMLVVMFALTAVMGLGGAVLLTAMRADQVGAATLRGLTRHTELADQFRADVARAMEAPAKLGDLVAGPACLILHTGAEHIIYRWNDGKLDRTVRTGSQETRRPIALASANATVEFSRPAGERPLLTVRVIESPPHGMTRHVEVSAALGGDTR